MQPCNLVLVIRRNIEHVLFCFYPSADGDVALRTASAVCSASFTDPLFKLITNQSASSGLFFLQQSALQNCTRWMRSLRDDELA